MRLAFAICVVFGTVVFPLAAQAPADLILLNGRIFTSDPSMQYANAVAIRGERIQAVGDNEAIRRLAGPETRVVDLAGRTVVPGFND